MNNPISLQSLRDDLKNMQLLSTDRILVHSSLRAIGPIEDGADGLIRVLMDSLAKGSLLMPAHTWKQVNKENPRFIHQSTKSCVGTLSEVFRTTPGVLRSAHPTHSNSGWGKGVEELLSGQEKFDTPCAVDSTYGRLAEEGFKIFLLGVDFSRNTAVHGLEERAEVPGRLTEERENLEVEFADGSVVASPQHRHTGPNSERYVRVQKRLFDKGILHRGKLGNADVLWMHANELFEDVTKLLRADPSFFTRENFQD